MKPARPLYDPEFRYVQSKDMGPDYLQRKFDKIRKELAKEKDESNVRPLVGSAVNRTRKAGAR